MASMCYIFHNISTGNDVFRREKEREDSWSRVAYIYDGAIFERGRRRRHMCANAIIISSREEQDMDGSTCIFEKGEREMIDGRKVCERTAVGLYIPKTGSVLCDL